MNLELIPGTYEDLKPGDRVRFRDTKKQCHRPGLHVVREVTNGIYGAHALRQFGMHQHVFLVGLRNNKRRYTLGQYYPCDFILVRRETEG